LSTDITPWLAALEARHLANLTRPELTRALRALSSCYVERREKLVGGAALEGAGKRAAFALFYGPLHFLTIAAILNALDAGRQAPKTIVDLGCGTGVGGAAWAAACGKAPAIVGIDRSAWAAAEATLTYRELGVRGKATVGDAVRQFPESASSRSPDSAILLAYAVNELPDASRDDLLQRVAAALRRGSRLLVVEPIARRDRPWWPSWADALVKDGAREDEWRFPASLPPLLRQIAKSAGLDPRELTARTISRI
jgi:SAM-dependent methyltransferase